MLTTQICAAALDPQRKFGSERSMMGVDPNRLRYRGKPAAREKRKARPNWRRPDEENDIEENT